MKIAILNSGGNSTTSNIVLGELVKYFVKEKIDVYGVSFGFNGLIKNDFKKLLLKDIKGIENYYTIFLKTSRSTEFATAEGLKKAVSNLQKRKIDLVVVIGGNGSIIGASRLKKYEINVMFVPSTIDNDLGYTDFSLGFDTAVSNAVDAIKKIRGGLESDNRGALIETMGRDCGDLTTMVAGRTSANYFVAKDEDIKDIMLKAKLIVDSGVESPLIIVKEHLYDVEQLADALTNYTKKPFKSTVLGYIQRGGIPTDFDINLAQLFVERLIKLIEAKKFNRAVGVDDGKILDVALEKASKVKKSE